MLEPATGGKFPGMRKVVMAACLVGLTALAAAGWLTVSRERAYRQFLTDGDLALAAMQPSAAIEAFSGAIALKPDSMLAWLRRGEVYRQQGDDASALRDLRQAGALDPTSPRVEEQLGDVHASQKRWQRAGERYEAALAIDERQPRLWVKLALALLNSNQLDRSAHACRQALAQDETLARAHYLLGVVLAQQQRPKEATDALVRATALEPDNLDALEALASLHEKSGRYADEVRLLRALAAIEPSSAPRQARLGLALARTGRFEDAVLTLATASERFNDQGTVLVALSQVWLERGDASSDRIAWMKAVEAARRATERTASSEAQLMLGRALFRLGDTRQALRALTTATQRPPVAEGAFAALADAAERAGRLQTARDALLADMALRGDLGDGPLGAARATRIANLCLRTGDRLNAVTWFERALARRPDDEGLKRQLDQARRGV